MSTEGEPQAPGAPMVDIADIMHLVGPTSFQRGLRYARGGAVDQIDWDEDARMLTARVRGSNPSAYRCTVLIAAASGKPLSGICSCPVNADCKHVAAALLQSNTISLRRMEGLTLTARATERAITSSGTREEPTPVGWKGAVLALSERSEGNELRKAGQPPQTGHPPQAASLGLLFELREQIPRSRNRWNGPSAQSATADVTRATARLSVRPVIRSATGNWIRGNITWNSLGFQSNRLDLATGQQRWFAQFAALHRATRDLFSGTQEVDWFAVDDFHSPLFWPLLREAGELGIPFVTGKKESDITVGLSAEVGLNAKREGSAESDAGASDLRLEPSATIDGTEYPIASIGLIGDHGLYFWQLGKHPRFVIAPTRTPLTPEQRAVLEQASAVVIPEPDVDEFLRDYYPKISRTIAVASSDDSVVFPEVIPPVLVLTVKFLARQSLKLSWDWQYGSQRKSLRGADDRDYGVEHATIARVERMVEDSHDLPHELAQDLIRNLLDPRTLQDLDAAEFTVKMLPRFESLQGVRVDTVGERPDYTELRGVPRLVFTTVETDTRDWFDLGVYVTIDGRNVPFAPLFAALSKGKTRLLLVDNSYLSLNQPVFAELALLIEEASVLPEWETGVRISRYQSSLWAEFEDLADQTEQAVAWRESAGELASLDGVSATALPPGVTAVLRPYQQHGFDWLAFLFDHGLGGILADDMGLGKTLQALSLMQHAVDHRAAESPRHPFLIVAPTSVVPNWRTEAARFTPGLVIRTVSTTKESLDDIAEGADIVVTSYALFRLGFEGYQSRQWAGLILDEAQFVKNHASKAHECAVALTAPFKLAITGTPMENSLMDLWSLFAVVAPGLFPSSRRFTEDYVRPISAGDRPELLAKLRRRIRPLMMRRTKELVATDLPSKQEQVLRIELAPRHRKIYDTVLQKERQKLLGLVDDLDRNRFIVFRSLTLLRLLSLDASLVDEKYADIPSSKLDALFEQLEDVIAEGHRALVFSQFTSFLKKAAARMDAAGIAYEYLDGSTLKRADVLARFKSGTAPLFLISLKAGGFGLNLTEADYVFLLDPWWNPATESQAIDRTHRIGQTRPVNVYRLVASGTIEEKVMKLKETKAKLFDAVMDDDAVFSTALTADDIRGLLE